MSYIDMPESISATLISAAKKYPNKEALVDEGKSITYLEFERSVNVFASILSQEYGVCKGDICALLIVNSIDFCVVFYALMRLGAIAMPISTKLKADEILYPLKHSGCSIAVVDAAWLYNIEKIIDHTNIENIILTDNVIKHSNINTKISSSIYPAISSLMNNKTIEDTVKLPNDKVSLSNEAILIYTSGTTGRPKGALINNFNVLHSISTYEKLMDLCDEDKTIISTPIFHITGLVALLCLFVKLGATTYLHSSFNARKTIDCIKINRISFVHASPTIFLFMAQELNKNDDISSLVKGACGSANLPVSIIKKMRSFNPKFKMYPVYGLTETTSPAAVMPFDPIDGAKEGSSGVAIPGIELRVVEKRHGQNLPRNTIGQLEVKGSCVIATYFHASEEDEESFHEGWFNTGDVAYIDKEGFVYILDRVKDMINRGGEKIYSIEVENVLNSHPNVIESAVVGKYSALYGEEVHALVRTDNKSLNEEMLDEYLRNKLAKYKLPASYEFVEVIPKNQSGKIDKKAIRRVLQENKNDT